MSTKIKGDKIKEGSIPLSALSNEVKDKIENAGGGADWNAQKGEAGYIENKPFKVIKSNNNEITNINSYFISTEDAYYPISDLFIRYDNKVALLVKEKQELYWGDGASIEVDTCDFYISDNDSNIIVSSHIEFELIIALNSDFIPDTVLKTTPQTLSDDDKNQALSNLGIDPLVWKYICNPHIMNYESYSGTWHNPIPKELSDIIYQNGKFNHLVLSTILVKTFYEEDSNSHDVKRISSYTGGGSVYYDDSEFYYDSDTRLFIV